MIEHDERILTGFPTANMFFHMKTTLMIPDHVFRELKRRAARQGETLSAVVAEALRRGLAEPEGVVELAPMPVVRMGKPKVDLADRDALHRAMDGV
jgi:plasmid stability protein